MNVVQTQRTSLQAKSGSIARPVNYGHVFPHLRPSTFIILGLILLASSLMAVQRVLSQNGVTGPPSALGILGLSSPELEAQAVADSETADEANNNTAGINEDSPQAGGATTEGVGNSSASTSIVIETSGQVTVNGETTEVKPQVTVNGTAVELPKNGTYKQDIKEEDSRTKIRTKVNTNGASINISTKNSVETGSD